MPYLLDANVFIQAKRLHYGMDFCPAFWDWLISKNAAKEVFSIEKLVMNCWRTVMSLEMGPTIEELTFSET